MRPADGSVNWLQRKATDNMHENGQVCWKVEEQTTKVISKQAIKRTGEHTHNRLIHFYQQELRPKQKNKIQTIKNKEWNIHTQAQADESMKVKRLDG